MNGLDEAADVRRAGDGHQGHTPGVLSQQAVEIVLVEAAVGLGADVDDVGARPPGQIVGVMLHLSGDDDGIGAEGVAPGQLVDGLGGVFAEDDSIGAQVGPHKAANDLVCLIVGHGAEARLEARAPVNAGVVGHESLDGADDIHEGRRAGGVV